MSKQNGGFNICNEMQRLKQETERADSISFQKKFKTGNQEISSLRVLGSHRWAAGFFSLSICAGEFVD